MAAADIYMDVKGNRHFFPLVPANLSRYSMVNQEMQTASIRANFGLSMGSSLMLRAWIDGMVLRVIPTVDTTTNAMDITDMTCNHLQS